MGRRRNWLTVITSLVAGAISATAQTTTTAQTAATPPHATVLAPDPPTFRPLPDIPTLMHQVEAHQRDDESRLRNYIYHQIQTLAQTDSHGGVKKQETQAYDVFWIDGVPVRKLISKDGSPISAVDLKKEDDRIDKEVRKVKDRRDRNDSKGEQTDPRGNDEVTVSRILELGTFSNPRRVQIAGRDTIAVDYAGDPHARTHNRAEEAVHDLAGTIWIDEQDCEIARTEGHFFRAFKIGGGLVADIREGTRFTMQQAKINNDVWLPTDIAATGAARFLLLFSFDGTIHVVDTDFRRFHTTSTLLPGVGKVDDSGQPLTPVAPTTTQPITPQP